MSGWKVILGTVPMVGAGIVALKESFGQRDGFLGRLEPDAAVQGLAPTTPEFTRKQPAPEINKFGTVHRPNLWYKVPVPVSGPEFNKLDSLYRMDGIVARVKEKIVIENGIVSILQERVDALDRERIPYLVNDKEIEALFKGLPTDDSNNKFWIDIVRNNDEGKITARAIHRYINYAGDTHTAELRKIEITGFDKHSASGIMAERTVRILLRGGKSKTPWEFHGNSGGWDKYINRGGAWRDVGTGFVLDKESGKPTYYIATNKHVSHSSYVADQNGISIQRYGGRIDTKLPIMDALYNTEEGKVKDKNLKGLITFGGDAKDAGGVKSSFLERKKDVFHSITLHNDFGSNQFSSGFLNGLESNVEWKNKDYYKLSQAKDFTNWNKKIELNSFARSAIDLTVFRVEFKSKEVDPFDSWWSKRPTQVRMMKHYDVHNRKAFWKQLDDGTWVEQAQNKEETGINIDNTIFTNGFPAYDAAGPKQKLIYNLERRQGIFESYIHNDSARSGSFNAHYYGGRITYPKGVNILSGGASGSPVFDKNLKIIGAIWGGGSHSTDNEDETGIDTNGAANKFVWLGQDIKYDYLDRGFGSQSHLFKKFYKVKPYNYICGPYSVKSELTTGTTTEVTERACQSESVSPTV